MRACASSSQLSCGCNLVQFCLNQSRCRHELAHLMFSFRAHVGTNAVFIVSLLDQCNLKPLLLEHLLWSLNSLHWSCWDLWMPVGSYCTCMTWTVSCTGWWLAPRTSSWTLVSRIGFWLSKLWQCVAAIYATKWTVQFTFIKFGTCLVDISQMHFYLTLPQKSQKTPTLPLI